MWKLASHGLRRRLRPPQQLLLPVVFHQEEEAWLKAVAAGTAATFGVVAVTAYVWNEDSLSGRSGTAAFCEPLTVHFSHFRRHQTIQKLQKTATKSTLKERYKVEWKKPLGQGSFGSVYIGTDRKTGERVAVKKISKTLTDNVAFQREMDALLHLRQAGGHPNICGLLENFDEGGYFYLVLDLVSGGEMFDHLCAQGPYSEADAARLIREAACALAFCHGINIVHGDLKPENLMLSSEHASDAVIKVVDFGCAQVTHGDMADVLVGTTTKNDNRGVTSTPAYSPPEILEAKNAKVPRDARRIEPSFDMWALGVILYIMLTGVHPFDLYGNSTDEEIEEQVLARKMPPLRNSPLTTHLSNDAIALIEQLLQWEAKKRLTAYQVLENPWVRGDTARTDKIANSDKRLSKYKAFKSKLEAKVFADMVSLSSSDDAESDVVDNHPTSLIEQAFHKLDPSHKGYVTTSDLQRVTKAQPSTERAVESSEEEQLSLSGFAGLMSEAMKNRYYPKGHIIYHEGEKGDVMYFLNSGAIEVFTKDGFSKILRRPGNFFGEGALLHPKKIRSASIRCVTPVHAIEISREYFEKYMQNDYELKLNLREKDKIRKRQRAQALLQLEQSTEELIASRNDYIFTEGDPGDEIYILEEGRIDHSVKGNKVFTVQQRGEIFGVHAFLFGRPRNVTAQCKSETCKLHILRSSDFTKILNSHPAMKESFRDMCHRREFQKAICVMTQKPFPENVKDLRKAFDAVDINHSGTLELPNIRNAIKTLDAVFTEQDIRDILKSLDIDESGTVSWEEFKRLFGMDSGDAR